MAVYSYGAFQLNNMNNGYTLLSKHFDGVPVLEALFKISRYDGMKSSGAIQNERVMDVIVRVTGSSRLDLESKLDTLGAAMNLRGQQLNLHALDGRYWIADCIGKQVPLEPMKSQGSFPGSSVIHSDVTLTFLCQQPFPIASAASTFDTGNVTPSAAGSGTYQYLFTLSGGGTIFSYPQLRLYNNGANATTINATTNQTITLGNVYTSLTIHALPAAANAGDVFTIGSGGTTQNVTLSANAANGATTVSVFSFTANATYASGVAFNRVVGWSALSIAQMTDNMTLTLGLAQTSPNGFPVLQGEYVDSYSDPSGPNGRAVVKNSLTATPLGFSGSFPTLEPTSTTFFVTITHSAVPTVRVVVSYQPRYES